MENISSILKKIIANHKCQINQDQIIDLVLNNASVQEFLQVHKLKITDDIFKRSLNNLYIYIQECEHPSKVNQGYEPYLFVNGNMIDFAYRATLQKRIDDRKKYVQNLIHLVDLPLSLKNVELSAVDKTPERIKALQEIGLFIQQYHVDKHAKGLYLEGDFGVGKTYMMAGLANGLAQEGNEVVFLHVPSFIAGLSDHFKDNSLTDKIMKIATATIVIFDDIGAESLTEWSRDEVLGVILQIRMDNQLPTFFTSNMNFDALTIHFAQVKNSYDDVKAKRLMERIRCLSKEVFVGGENRRR